MIVFVLPLNKYIKGNLAMSDKKELLTVAVIAAALMMMVTAIAIPSGVIASTDTDGISPAEGGNNEENGDDNDDSGNNDNDDDNKDDDDDDDDDGDGSNGNDGGNGPPNSYLKEYDTCVSDLSADDNVLTQDDVVDCYGQVFGPNPTHDLGSIDPKWTQLAPAPGANMPGFENMPFAFQQPGGQQDLQPLGQTQPQDAQPQQQQQGYPPIGDQQTMQPYSQAQQPQDAQPQLQSQQPEPQAQPQSQSQPQPQTQPQQQQQQQAPPIGDPTQFDAIGSGILDADTIEKIVKNRLGILGQ
jgi:hypothetical protein